MQGTHKPRLGDILVGRRLITEDQLRRAIVYQKSTGERLGTALVKLGFLTESQLTNALAGQSGLDAVDDHDLDIDEEIVRLLPNDFVKRFEVVPVKLEGGVLTVATANPNNLSMLDEVRFITGVKRVHPTIAAEMAIRRVIEKHYSTHALLDEIIKNGGLFDKALRQLEHEQPDVLEEDDLEEVYDLRQESEAAPIIAIVNYLLVESVRRAASDIHVEPYEGFFRVRMRIDGMLHTILTPPPSLHRAMISRMKIMAGMDIAKHRVPQDGHIGLEYTGEVLHYRVSTVPTVYGEKLVARLMKHHTHLAELDKVGLPHRVYEKLDACIRQPQGLVLVTGPTGSGKTTTVHAALNAVNREDNNIVSLEDPVESTIPGVNHIQINRKVGVDFMAGISSILRQDPDVVFVGEVRARDVARAAMEASLTGHLVFSTLHTNSAIEALTRLEDMGIEMFLVAGALSVVLAQRLVRRNCPQCKVPDPEARDAFRELGVPERVVRTSQPTRGTGCNHCLGSGFRGRVGVFEGLFVDDRIRALVRRRAPAEEIAEAARENGMRELAQGGLDLALAGLSTIEEVTRTVGSVMWREAGAPDTAAQTFTVAPDDSVFDSLQDADWLDVEGSAVVPLEDEASSDPPGAVPAAEIAVLAPAAADLARPQRTVAGLPKPSHDG